jgi:hypothetical protein
MPAALPFDKLFAKGRLDVWTAAAWLEGDPPQLVQRIVALSVASGALCFFLRFWGCV